MAINSKRYEEAAAALAELPRVERFEQLIEFPTRHMFKAIGHRDDFAAAVRAALDELGHPDVIIVERQSAKGKYVSLTFEIEIEAAAGLEVIYCTLEGLSGLKLLL